jgi:O-antigen/teichoic acid export membrane protein
LKFIKFNFLKSTLLKTAGVYTVFNIGDKVIPFLIIPIITRLISVEELGYYTLYQVIFNILVPILTISIDSSILLNYFKVDFEKFKIYFSNGLLLFSLAYCISFIFVWLFSHEISEALNFPIFWFHITLLIVVFHFITTLRKNLWQVNNQPVNFGLFSIALTLLKNITGLVLIYFFNFGWEGIVLGHFIGVSLFSLWSIASFLKEKLIVFDINLTFIKDMLFVGIPISLHSIGAWLSNSLNRIIINSLIGKAAVGSYGIGATFGIIITILGVAFNNAYVPYLFDKLKNVNDQIKFSLVKITYAYYAIILLFAISFSFFGFYFVDIIFGKDYSDTRVFLVPLIFASVFNGMYKMHVNYMFFLKKTFEITKITLFSGFLNIFLSYYMIKTNGLIGAAYSALAIQVITYAFTFYRSNKLYPMPWFKLNTNYK